jgi:hypothetical protein
VPSARVPALRLAAAAALLLVAPACGVGEAQHRPEILSTFPAADEVLASVPALLRVVYDEPIFVLNPHGVEVAYLDGEGNGVPVGTRSFVDPLDDHVLLVESAGGRHFHADAMHHVVVDPSAVVNSGDHYKLETYDFWFETGPAPGLFLSSDDGNVYEVDRDTGAAVATTAPPAGYVAREPLGSDGRLWVWLDPVVPGDSLVGTFTPGTATISTIVALAAETGDRAGGHLVLSRDGRTLYATAVDTGASRLVVHRVDVATLLEVGLPVVMSTPLAPVPTPAYRPALDTAGNRLFVSYDDGLVGGLLGAVDLATFTEVDVGPLAGLDPLPVPDGPGPLFYEADRDDLYVLSIDESAPAFVQIDADGLDDQESIVESKITGYPASLIATPDGQLVVQGLSAYSGLTGILASLAYDIGNEVPFEVSDDVGGVSFGATRVGTLLLDPFGDRFWAFADDGSDTVMTIWAYDDGDLVQLDLDAGTDGVQAVPLAVSAPGVVTGAATLLGELPW